MRVAKSLLRETHGAAVFRRRVRVLSAHLSSQLSRNARVLDVGTGDGSIAAGILKLRPDLKIKGIDVHQRPAVQIPVQLFDGKRIPFADVTFDCVMFVDVLHHTQNAASLMHEAARVTRRHVLIKDHLTSGLFARPTLRFMDWVGNWGHDVALTYNYLPEGTWRSMFAEARLILENWDDHLGLYPIPFNLVFDRRLHMIARVAKNE
jgi:SAM-dependent methyltransferase